MTLALSPCRAIVISSYPHKYVHGRSFSRTAVAHRRPECSRFRRSGEKRMRNGTSPVAPFSVAGSAVRHPPWLHSTARFTRMEPRLATLDNTRRPQTSRSPSLLLADVRVLFVNHGRIGTACSKQWQTGPAGVGTIEAGTPNRRQGQRENLWRSHTTRIWANVRAPVRFGPRRTACSKQWHTVSGPAQPSRDTRAQGHRRAGSS